ncbi:MAG: cation:proton antiporter [Prevotella sp.]|nr:cation:proton antiporter [Prevotella sp.]
MSSLPITNPTMVFFTVLIIILFAPIVMSKLRIPHIIGMVLAGVLIGPYGLNVLERDASFELFGKVGLLYIMFLAGLETDIQNLRQNIRKVGIFGLMTFLVPFVLMYIVSIEILHYSPMASLLLSCIMSTNTLIAYPIVTRYGLQRHQASTISVGATMLSLLISLIVIAAIAGSFQSATPPSSIIPHPSPTIPAATVPDASPSGSILASLLSSITPHPSSPLYWLFFALKFIVYCVTLIYLIPIVTRWFLRRYSDSIMQFIFILATMFFSAAVCELIGIEGIFGAFFSGLILNRFIPTLSPLMNRIEFIGNALFIPYFLIGVGMLIDLSPLFGNSPTGKVSLIFTVLVIVIIGTAGKALAAYLACISLKLPWKDGHLMFGLTSAHAAAAIAIVMIGMRLPMPDGTYLIGDDTLNGVVIMILFTCIISTIVTDHAARSIALDDRELIMRNNDGDDEKILVPVKYPETCHTLITLAAMMRNPQLERGLIALNVVYDDTDAEQNQQRGRRLLDDVAKQAADMDVKVQTQVRLATNIGNGIKHAFREFDCSEVIFGVHIHDNSSRVFWGDFAQSVFNGLTRQITIARCVQPLSTLRAFHVAVPSRAEYEPGFHRWIERLSRIATALQTRIVFHGRVESLELIDHYVTAHHKSLRAEYISMPKWHGVVDLMQQVQEDEMLVVITARQGTVSYKAALEHLPEELTEFYKGRNLMIIFPDQFGPAPDTITFATAQHKEQRSAYQELIILWHRLKRKWRSKK